jgi:hypothetical protein
MQPGCDGEHTPDVHPLMGTGDAGVNLVAGGGDGPGEEGEAMGEYEYEYEDEYEDEYGDKHEGGYGCEYEGLWVGTIGAMEMPDRSDQSLNNVTNREPRQDDGQAKTGSKGLVEQEHKFQVNDYSEGEMAGDEQWDSEPDLPNPGAGEAEDPQQGPSQHPPGSRVWPPHSAGASRPSARPRPRADPDWQWEEARHSAWLRQLLSDDSSDEEGNEDEERYGRFAESGRWMTKLYKVPQHPTVTLGRECSV